MVDRYRSILEQDLQASSGPIRNRSLLLNENGRNLKQLMKRADQNAYLMKECIGKYRKAVKKQEEQAIVGRFKQEGEKLQEARRELKKQFDAMRNQRDTPQKLILKEHLLKTVQNELNLDIEMNEMISNRENQLELIQKTYSKGSEKLKNALQDLQQKRDQIIYLQEQVRECVQLLEIIGVLTFQNSEKISLAAVEIKAANQNINQSLKEIEKAKMRQKKCRNRMCCAILIGIVIIIIAVIFIFGASYFKWFTP